MTQLVFMSPEHVAAMNARLAADSASIAACKPLTRQYQIAYELDDGGKAVWWTMSFEPATGVRFHLAPPQGQADIHFTGGYWEMLDFTRKSKAGEVAPTAMPLRFSGDPMAYAAISGAFAAAQAAAEMRTVFPKKPE